MKQLVSWLLLCFLCTVAYTQTPGFINYQAAVKQDDGTPLAIRVLFDVDKVSRRLVESLSSREAEVLDCVVRGMNTKGVATALYISENTVKFHLKNLYDKFDVHNRVELVAAVRELG